MKELLLNKLNNSKQTIKIIAKIANTVAKIIGLVYPLFNKQELIKSKKVILNPAKRSELKQKYNTYIKLVKEVQDKHGFIDTDHCDSLLFSGLLGIDRSIEVKIEAARDSKGAWKRRPIENPCYPNHSKSTISRDMFIGLLWFIWENRRLDLANQIFEYGEKNDWIMGEGDIGRIYFAPGLQATLADIIKGLGGSNHSLYRNIPQIYTENKGFAAHLDVLHILLRGEVNKSISKKELELLEKYSQKMPRNSLFQFAYKKYIDGQIESSLHTLMDEKIFPSDRLPQRKDRKEGWIWQRDEGQDWKPANDNKDKKHSGGDLIFLAYLILSET